MNAATWGTLALELSIGIRVWNKRLRPWVLAGGLLMHSVIMIMITIVVGFFAPAMFVLYLAFVSPDIVQRLPNAIKHVGAKSRSRLRSVTADDRHDMREHYEVDNESSPQPPALTSADWIKTAEPYGDQPGGTLLMTNGSKSSALACVESLMVWRALGQVGSRGGL